MISDTSEVTKVADSNSNTALEKPSGFANSTTATGLKMKVARANQPTLVEKGDLKFVITDAPSDLKMESHLTELVRYQVAHVARAASEAVYDTSALTKAGITVHDLSFPDGDPPSAEVVEAWLDLVGSAFGKGNVKGSHAVERLDPKQRISVHCVAGLGRAPVLVAIALIEYGKMEPVEAVHYIRERRRGAINTKQLKWLVESYVKTRGKANSADCCVIC